MYVMFSGSRFEYMEPNLGRKPWRSVKAPGRRVSASGQVPGPSLSPASHSALLYRLLKLSSVLLHYI